MEILQMTWRSFLKQKKRNILLIIELFLCFFIMLLILGRLEYSFSYVDEALKVVTPELFIVNSFPMELHNEDNLTKNSFMGRDKGSLLPTLELSKLLEKDNRVDKIGKTYVKVLEPNSNNPGELKANVLNLLAIFDDRNAVDFYDYKVIKGESLKSYYKNNENKDELVPLLIGPPLEKKNPIGSIVELPGAIDYKTHKPIKYKIVGVLDPTKPTEDDGVEELGLQNNGYVVISSKLPAHMDGTREAFQTLLIKLKNKADVEAIEKEYTDKIKTHNITLVNLGDRYAKLEQYAKKDYTGIFYVVIMLLLSSFGILSVSFSTLIKRQKEIGVRFALGARKSNLSIMLGLELVLLYLISGVAAYLCAFGVEHLVPQILIDLKVVGIAYFVAGFFMLISVIPLVIKTFKLEPIELIREA
ncbi:ABC transporter permease [Clostridium folliculivorans]|uniref:ABC transporter permease n=1 Tax=Clostridium folliculivorans TaxID=2886038 RepID=UPI0021C3CD5A|nr:ABC transporter permease [Clostridium folliculivorans]GKU28442.1 hypothetical protein CFB3_05480 [Clostridium folliculivorans]